MKLDEQFMSAVMAGYDAQASADEMLPAVLARACVSVLDVAGAGLSITDELRVPLAASDHVAAAAERLQTTLGEGPCLTATVTEEALVADQDMMEARWPMFHRQILQQTPFRFIASLPLRSLDQQRLGALDLYAVHAGVFTAARIALIQRDVADSIAAMLFDTQAATLLNDRVPVHWLTNTSVSKRMAVWVAVGIMIEHAGVTNTDALAALRAHAFSHDTSLDDIAEQMTSGRLRPGALLS